MVPFLFVVALCAGASLAAPPATAPASTTAPSASDVELGKKLSRKLPQVNAKQMSLGHFLDFVRDAGGVNVVVNWRELARQKVDERRVVNFAARDVAVGDMLHAVLDSVSSKISFDAKAGAVYVTSRLDLFARAGDVRVKGDDSDASARANAALEKTVPDVQLESVRLRAAFDLVGKTLHVPLEVDWNALAQVGVYDEQRVTLHLRKPTGAEALYWIIRPLPATAPVVFTVREGKVIVTKGAERKIKGK
jgi:hypothetical protein